jgi:ribose/xylose/arabinose/galactoside ABC-type transport system permease subunit
MGEAKRPGFLPGLTGAGRARTAAAGPASNGSTRRRIDPWRFGIWIALIVVVAVLMVISPSFRDTSNLTNVLQQNSLIGVVACGMFVMMVSGGFDLSVGAVGATVSVAAAALSVHYSVPIAIIGGLALGTFVGLLNGLLIAKGRINAFMTTFAMASVVTGVLFIATSASPVVGNVDFLQQISLFGTVLGIPDVFVVYLVVVVITWVLMRRTKWGHYVYSVGGNRDASFLSGVPVVSAQMLAFCFGGFMAALGGLLLLGESGIGQPASASDWPLTAIAICVIAGVSLQGGEGRIQDTIAACLLLGVVDNGLNLLNVSPYVQPAVTGAVILIAVAGDQISRRRSATAKRTGAQAKASADASGQRSPAPDEQVASGSSVS